MESHHSLFLFFLLSLFHIQSGNSDKCPLDFSEFPYEPEWSCFNGTANPQNQKPLAVSYCCNLALKAVFQAMALNTNRTRVLFLDHDEARSCTNQFQTLYAHTDFSTCDIQRVVSPDDDTCPKHVQKIADRLGGFQSIRVGCDGVKIGNSSESGCIGCVNSFNKALDVLKGDDSHACEEGLLVALASLEVGSKEWVEGLFSCLWDEIQDPWDMKEEPKRGKSKTMIYLSAIIVLGAGILAAVIYKITKKRLKKECEKDIEDLSVQVKSLATESESPYSVSGLYIFSRREIAKATDNFNASNLIGEGSAGKVYKGMMPSGQRVAVKQINAEKKAETFGDEIVNVAKVRHPNLVCIVGYCDREEYCLVYEYCVNGNLSQWLWGDSHVLKWEQRIRIATGSARALWFLHNYPSGRLVHRDIKPTNILLDDKLNPKLSDFGLSKFLDVDESYMFTEVKGTTGYLDPEYVTLGRVSLASDVYSLGIVLLQLLSGKKVIDFSTPKPRSLVSEARNVVIKGGDISTLVDPRLKGEYDKQAFERVLSVAILCTASSERERPCMQEVLHELEDASLFPC